MRTVILVSGVLIAEAIRQGAFVNQPYTLKFVAFVLLFSILMDIVDFLRG